MIWGDVVRLDRLLPAFAITILASALGGVAVAAGAPAVQLVAPQLVSEPYPHYPPDAMKAGDEAWVHLRFGVTKDGTVQNVRVVDGFYTPAFSAAAIAAAQKAKFKPGTANGAAVDWKNVDQNLAFSKPFAPGTQPGASDAFRKKYKDVDKLLKNKQYAQAKAMIEGMISDHTVKALYEYAVSQTAIMEAESGLGHREAALAAIRRATPYNPSQGSQTAPSNPRSMPPYPILPDFLDAKLEKTALRNRFVLEVKTGRYLNSLETFDRMKRAFHGVPPQSIAKEADQIRQVLASDGPLPVRATLEDLPWTYRMARHDFTMTSVKGSVTSMTLNCDRHDAGLKFQADVEWVLPAAWGMCDLTVKGAPGTQFTLVEFAKPPPKAAAKSK